MVSLLIDGVEVVLPSDFSTEIKVENSFFTKNGEYTYEFKLPLNHPTNAALYSHLHRVNNASELKEKRQAILIVDNRCYINGTEIITDWTDDSVSVQLASGNSELNYLIGASLSVSFLDMGTADLQGTSGGDRYSLFTHSLQATYPTYDFVSVPVGTPSGIINEWVFNKASDGTYSLRFPIGGVRIVQPYLCAMVRRMLTALGYTIGVNQLEESRYSRLVCLHDVNTLEYAKMLPGWSVKDFFENLERLLNLVLVVNNRTRAVDIIFANQFYLGASEVHLQVEDEYEVEIDEDNADLMTNANVGYDLPNSDYFRFAKMDKHLVNMCEKTEYESFVNVAAHLRESKPMREIATDVSTGRQYIYRPYVLPLYDEGLYPMREVNQYATLDRGGEEVLLKFVPGAQVYHQIPCYSSGTDEVVGSYIWTIPSIEGEADEEAVDTSEKTMSELISEQAAEKAESGSGRLFLAFWHGCTSYNPIGLPLPVPYPLAMADSQFQVLTEQLEGAPTSMVDPEYSLRLSVLDQELYNGTYDIDTRKSYKFYTSDPNLPDPHLIFVIRNKRFVCVEMNFQVAQGQKQKRWSLTCYPITISEAEVYKRWILSTGNWRDGGVWLDDGRWLDG